MPLGEAVLLFVLALFGVGGVSYGVVRWDRGRIARLRGEANARKLLKESLTCLRCDAVINPNVDVYYKGTTKRGSWWCQSCFKEIIQ